MNWIMSLIANLLLALAILVIFGMLISAIMTNDFGSAFFLAMLLLVGVIFLSL